MEKKLSYCIRNWSEYNKVLVQRLSITDEAIKGWQEKYTDRKERRPRKVKKLSNKRPIDIVFAHSGVKV